jgi:hypothetical protein
MLVIKSKLVCLWKWKSIIELVLFMLEIAEAQERAWEKKETNGPEISRESLWLDGGVNILERVTFGFNVYLRGGFLRVYLLD